MTKEKYYVISSDEDGEVSLHEYTKEEMVKGLEMNEYRETYFGEVDYLKEIVRDKVPKDINYGGAHMIIIKGRIVVPKSVEKVTKLEIE